MERVELVKTLNQNAMPIGSLGTILKGSMDRRGMLLIEFDNGYTIPMYRDELEPVTVDIGRKYV